MRCAMVAPAVAVKIVDAEIIAENENDVGLRGFGGRKRAGERTKEQQKEAFHGEEVCFSA